MWQRASQYCAIDKSQAASLQLFKNEPTYAAKQFSTCRTDSSVNMEPVLSFSRPLSLHSRHFRIVNVTFPCPAFKQLTFARSTVYRNGVVTFFPLLHAVTLQKISPPSCSRQVSAFTQSSCMSTHLLPFYPNNTWSLPNTILSCVVKYVFGRLTKRRRYDEKTISEHHGLCRSEYFRGYIP